MGRGSTTAFKMQRVQFHGRAVHACRAQIAALLVTPQCECEAQLLGACTILALDQRFAPLHPQLRLAPVPRTVDSDAINGECHDGG